ncbi:MAG: maleylacetoacetate isomerase [Myxococcaceae bacterium]
MKLYNYWRSSCSWRVRIGLYWKQQPFSYLPVHLLKDGGQQKAEPYTRLNPMQSVPLLEVEDGGRLFHLAQSMAILEYLEERWPEPPLLPADRLARARVRQAAEIVNSGIQPYQNTSVQKHVKHELHADEKAWARHFIGHGLRALEALLRSTAGRYAVGDQVTLADCFLVPQLYHARRYEVDLESFPTLTRVEAACTALSAFQAAHPDRQPDAEA